MKACICKLNPEQVEAHAQRMCDAWPPKDERGYNALLDHRCPVHGEKAQPKVWGRHTTLELIVTPRQWIALAVKVEDEK
jgi:hypothetical protein